MGVKRSFVVILSKNEVVMMKKIPVVTLHSWSIILKRIKIHQVSDVY